MCIRDRVSTKRSLIFNQLNKELYQKFFMNTEELQACRDGYIYIHDMSARRDTMNCCLFDVEHVLKGGFEMGNLWYNDCLLYTSQRNTLDGLWGKRWRSCRNTVWADAGCRMDNMAFLSI